MFTEMLENRRLFSAAPGTPLSAVVDANGVLQVTGTDGGDQITISLVHVLYSQPNIKVTIAPVVGASTVANSLVVQVPRAGVGKIRVHGLGGDDVITMDGSGGPFTGIKVALFGDAGNDTLNGDAGDDMLVGGQGNDSIVGGNGNNILIGNGGNDTLTAGSGHNLMFGGFGNDQITVGDNNNLVDGGPGDDSITVGNGANVVFGSAGNDSIMAGAGADTLIGGFGADIITTTSDHAVIFAGPGNDTVNGVLGDTIWGGDGADSLTPAPAPGNHIHEGDAPNVLFDEAIWRALFLF
ncbi:MAG: hypothetical protein M3O30_04710 [Planctomycetota bacterium]|nr:hypothetical protein [Planctomycetota bacterium]